MNAAENSVTADDIKQNVIDFTQGWTVETTPGQATKVDSFQEHFTPGTNVAVTFLPGSDYKDTVATAARLRREGFNPAPHFCGRSVTSKAELDDFLARCKGEADIDQVVALAGGVSKPLGPYDSSMDMLESGLFDKHGITTIGIAGHPEGSMDISDEELRKALTWKNDLAQRSDAEFYIITQFVFEAAPIIAWDKRINAEGNQLPIHIGAPGLATLKTLIAHSKACGIGASIRFLTRQAMNVTKLLNISAPDKLFVELANYKANDPACGIRKVHMYPLGGLKRTAFWTNEVAKGAFDLSADKTSFKLQQPLP